MFSSSIKKICFLGLSGFAAVNTQVQAQDFYKWVDANGSTHYTTTPPPKMHGVNGKGKIKTYNSRVEQINTNRVLPTNSSAQPAPSTPVQPQQPTQNSSIENKAIQLPSNIEPAPAPLPAKLPTTSGDDQNFNEIKK